MAAITATDEQLLQEFAACGAPELFAELFRRWHGRLISIFKTRTRSLDDAREVVQQAFVNLWRNAAKFRGDSKAYTWMVAIATNCHRDRGRRFLSRRQVQSPDTRIFDRLLDHRSGPEEAIEHLEERCQFAVAVQSLSAKQRAIIVLLDIEGDDYEVAAEKLNIPVGTVRSRRHRALNHLRQVLAP